MGEKIYLKVIGGLGDVSLTRKYPALCSNGLNETFSLESIADIYDSSKLKNKNQIEELLNEIGRNRLKGKINHEVRELLKTRFTEGLNYFQLEKDNPQLPDEFFSRDYKETVVDISVPNKYHFPLAKQVLTKSNYHILIEKPITASLEQTVEFEQFLKQANHGTNQKILMDAEHYSHYGNIMYYLYNFKSFCEDSLGNHGLGKIKEFELTIEEDEGFESERNQEIIEIAKSGGGQWLDTGTHPIGFLRNLNLNIDYNSIQAQPYKYTDPRIADSKYGETSMEVEVDLIPKDKNYFLTPCHARISVGKGFPKRKKMFSVKHENGYVEINTAEKTLSAFNSDKEKLFKSRFERDAFYNVFNDLRKSVLYGKKPMTSIQKAIANAKDIFLVYSKAKPLIVNPENRKNEQK